MEMLETKQENGIVFLKLSGRLDLAGVGQVEAAFKSQTNDAQKGLVIDAAELSFLASLGMRMLMMGAKAMKAKGGKIVIVNPQEEVENALRMSGLDQVIPIVESEAAAISELG